MYAGCPADDFLRFVHGGNPIYNWKMKRKMDTWWSKRLQTSFELFDVTFVSTTSEVSQLTTRRIPAEAENTVIGKWVKVLEYMIYLKQVKRATRSTPIIIEDLGFMDEDVIFIDTGFPGMRILEFRFYEFCEDPKSGDLPHHYPLSMQFAYTGTHDNDTILEIGISRLQKKLENFVIVA